MERPNIKIKLQASDWFIEMVGALFLILMIGVPFYYFEQLPDLIPIHFIGLGISFLPVFLILIFGVIGVYLYKALKKS